MLKTDLIHRQTGSGYLTLKNGESGQIAWNIEFRRKGQARCWGWRGNAWSLVRRGYSRHGWLLQ
jgi:hypothetical protein